MSTTQSINVQLIAMKKDGKIIEGKNVLLNVDGWEFLEKNYKKDYVLIVTPSIGYQELVNRVEAIIEDADIFVLAYSSALQCDIDRIRQSEIHFK